MPDRYGVLSRDLWSVREALSAVLDKEPHRILPSRAFAGYGEVVGWAGPRGAVARRVAKLRGVPFRSVRIGPLRSVRPDPDQPAMSIVVEGIRPPSADDAAAARGLDTLRRLRLSWRNDGRDRLPLGPGGHGFVLIVAARREGSGRGDRVLRQAGVDNPGASLVVVADSREPAELARAVARTHAGAVPVVGTNPWALFDAAARVYGPDGDLGTLARLAGRDPVPIGAGGDLDETSERLFARTYLEDPTYLDAWRGRQVDFETAADQLAWLRDRFLENSPRSFCVGVSRWKAAQVARFLDGPDGPASRHGAVAAAVSRAAGSGGRIVAWETRMPGRLETACAAAGVDLLRMEDGFLRSVGLGAAFMPGASCVLDGRGIYYDPRRDSDLEHILSRAEFDEALLARAAALRHEVVALRLSKYNVGRADALDGIPRDRPVVLVPGQVEDDASVLLGSPRTPTNLALLEAARRNNPGAYLIFKPHPDVQAGLRRGRLAPEQTAGLADRVIGDVSIVDLLDRVDAVETMTSLAGFEALMRGRRTIVHGRPFYSGWGLTTDLDPVSRRERRLTLDQLVAGALILYPRYLDPVTGLRCPPEVLVRRLAEARDAASLAMPAQVRARAAYVRARHALLGPLGLALRRVRGAVRTPAPPAG